MTNHQNDERTVHCPVEGCDATPLARGVNLHVNRSSGGGHGPRGEVPDHVSFDNLETVGEREVEMDYPEERDNERHARLCPYCSQTFSGGQGLMIHLGQKEGRDNHPSNPKDRHEPSDFPRVEVDADGNVQGVADNSQTEASSDTGKGAVPTARVFRLIADLTADGEMQTAHRVRRALLGADNDDRPFRDTPPHRELYEALLQQRDTEQSDSPISAVLEDDGVSVQCQGETAHYTAGEARDVATGLDRHADDSSELREFVEFLRYAADVLEGKLESNRPPTFQEWR